MVKALENNLMLAMREIELRMPDSGAREAAAAASGTRAGQLRGVFRRARCLAGRRRSWSAAIRCRRSGRRSEERLKLVADLETDAAASAMKAYFFIALAIQLRRIQGAQAAARPGLLAAHPGRSLAEVPHAGVQPTYSAEGARDLIGQETGFGEVHLLIGQRAVLNGNLAAAYRELTRARELLPDSVSIALALANVTFSYARYADALALFDRILASPAATGSRRRRGSAARSR